MSLPVHEHLPVAPTDAPRVSRPLWRRRADGTLDISWLAIRALWVLITWSAPWLSAQTAPAVAARPAPVRRPGVQDAETFQALNVRVLAVRRPGFVEVDRGARDLVRPEDRAIFRPLGRTPVHGHVTRVDDRTALVELDDPAAAIEPGMPGVVLVPGSRIDEAEAAAAAAAPFEPQGPRQPHAPWRNEDEGYEAGMPLLASVDILKPSQRPMRMSGRVYFLASAGRASLDDRTDSLVRLGTSVLMENPFGEGGEFHFEGELNNRTVYVDDQVDRAFSKGRLDRLSYSWGGTRWNPVRQEAGRFLQHGMPEFGLVDGYEWSRRNDNGSRFGGSIGYMPEPDVNLTTGKDFQVSGFYRWVADESERFAATVGVQKTWHKGHSDRDLLVAKVHILAEDGWRMNASAWIDYYGSNDDVKENGLEFTEAHASASRDFGDSGGFTVAYDHRRYPELLRHEYTPVLAESLADDRNDRLSIRGWKQLNDRQRLFGELGGWDDEDDNGFDVEAGLEVDDLLARGSWSSASLWFTDGLFSRSKGARISYGMPFDGGGDIGQWDVSYMISQHDNKGFNEDFADVVQQWLRFSWVFQLPQDWLATVSADARLWDDSSEDSQSVSLYLTKNF